MKPTAKKNLLVEVLQGETLVYDLDRHRAHCLNPQAALLLEKADGTRSVQELAEILEASFQEKTSVDAVRVGLDRLRRARVLDWDEEAFPALPPDSPKSSRKAAIRKLVTLGLVLPAVMTVVSPAAAQGTAIIPGRCDAPEDVGNCCRNHKTCVQVGPKKFLCQGNPC